MSFLLAVILCLSLCGTAVLAEEDAAAEAAAEPVEEAAEPVEEAAEPVEEAAEPAEEAAEPVEEAEEPAEEPAEPAEEPAEPAEEAAEPAEEAEEPSEEAEEPAEEPSEEPAEDSAVDFSSDIHAYSGTFTFPSTFNDRYTSAGCSYSDSLFAGAGTSYNHDLAKMSLALALSAGNTLDDHELFVSTLNGLDTYLIDPDSRGRTPAENVVALMKSCGFKNIMVNPDYLLSTEYNRTYNDGNNVGVCIGAKTLEDGTTLVAVAVRGGRYGDEWIGNFNINYSKNGASVNHIGFDKASDKVVSVIGRYATRYLITSGISSNVKIWIAGYSRGAAVANLAAAKICRGDSVVSRWITDLTPAKVYAYTFATPLTTKDANAGASQYGSIWNIVNPVDVMTQVPPAEWGYRHYGNTLYLPGRSYDYGVYEQYADAALAEFNRLRGENNAELIQIPLQAYATRKLFDSVTQAEGGEYDGGGLAGSLESTMRQHFIDHEYAQNTEFGEVVSGLPEKIRGYAKQAGIIGVDYVLDNFDEVIVGHFPESEVAWLNSVPASALSSDAVGRYVKLTGTADFEIYDGGGALQATVTGGKVRLEKGARIEAIVDTDGKVVVCVPQDLEARIRACASGTSVGFTGVEYSQATNGFSGAGSDTRTVKKGDIVQVNVAKRTGGTDISFVTPLEGDYNCDGRVDLLDAVVILRHAAGLGSGKLAAADGLGVEDAAALLKAYAG